MIFFLSSNALQLGAVANLASHLTYLIYRVLVCTLYHMATYLIYLIYSLKQYILCTKEIKDKSHWNYLIYRVPVCTLYHMPIQLSAFGLKFILKCVASLCTSFIWLRSLKNILLCPWMKQLSHLSQWYHWLVWLNLYHICHKHTTTRTHLLYIFTKTIHFVQKEDKERVSFDQYGAILLA